MPQIRKRHFRKMIFEDTICAPATSAGTGAISIIRVSGALTFDIIDKTVEFLKGASSSAKGYTIKYGSILGIDEVLVSIFRAPHSYTGEDSAEISCHASPYIVARIMERLCSYGARPAGPGEFTRRAFVNGKMDLTQAEAVADVIGAQSAAAHRIATNQLKGGFSKELKVMRDKLVDITSLMELELDFSEEDVEFADRSMLLKLLDEVIEKVDTLADSFRLGNAIKNGVPVAIAGAANSGKSTLLNALLGEDRAIVSEIAGTTRDTVEETMTVGDTLFRFIDTAGIRETSEIVEKMGIERTFSKISSADIVISVLDSSQPIEVMLQDLESVICKINSKVQKLIIAVNKVDILDCNKKVNIKNNIVSFADLQGFDYETVFISALEGIGIPELKELLQVTQHNRISKSGSSEDVTLITNLRHKEELTAASAALKAVRTGIINGLSSDLVSQDLRESLHHLGAITGEISTDEVLGRIFEKFCIGK